MMKITPYKTALFAIIIACAALPAVQASSHEDLDIDCRIGDADLNCVDESFDYEIHRVYGMGSAEYLAFDIQNRGAEPTRIEDVTLQGDTTNCRVSTVSDAIPLNHSLVRPDDKIRIYCPTGGKVDRPSDTRGRRGGITHQGRVTQEDSSGSSTSSLTISSNKRRTPPNQTPTRTVTDCGVAGNELTCKDATTERVKLERFGGQWNSHVALTIKNEADHIVRFGGVKGGDHPNPMRCSLQFQAGNAQTMDYLTAVDVHPGETRHIHCLTDTPSHQVGQRDEYIGEIQRIISNGSDYGSQPAISGFTFTTVTGPQPATGKQEPNRSGNNSTMEPREPVQGPVCPPSMLRCGPGMTKVQVGTKDGCPQYECEEITSEELREQKRDPQIRSASCEASLDLLCVDDSITYQDAPGGGSVVFELENTGTASYQVNLSNTRDDSSCYFSRGTTDTEEQGEQSVVIPEGETQRVYCSGGMDLFDEGVEDHRITYTGLIREKDGKSFSEASNYKMSLQFTTDATEPRQPSMPPRRGTEPSKPAVSPPGQQKEGQQKERPSDPSDTCSGCRYNGNCVPIGTRLNHSGGSYCDLNGEITAQKAVGESCQNDFECRTNTCSSASCVDLTAELEEQQSLLQSIASFLGLA